MSNCIKVINNKLSFTIDHFDIIGFKNLIDEAELKINNENCSKYGDEATNTLIAVWWFLSKNTKITPYEVMITFNEGRSSHTTRDFKIILNIISKFITKPFKKQILCHDIDYPEKYYEPLIKL